MNYIVLDMEWNQPVTPKELIKSPVILYGEVVQIGAVRLDENFRTIDTFNMMVSPEHYKEMNKVVSQLTKITTEALQLGFAFPLAVERFRQWCGEEFVFLTWGSNDIDILLSNLILYNLSTEWISEAYDVQRIFANQILKKDCQLSLSNAVIMLGDTPLEAHDALNDAVNTACVCQHLDMVRGIEEYHALKKKQKKKCGNTDDVIDVKFPSKRAVFRSCDITEFSCPRCRGNASCKEFLCFEKNKYIAVCECENGDELLVRLRLIKHSDHKYSAVRVVLEMNDENRATYERKKLKAIRRRHFWSIKCNNSESNT